MPEEIIKIPKTTVSIPSYKKLEGLDLPFDNNVKESTKWEKIIRKDLHSFTTTIQGAAAAVSANYGTFVLIYQPIEVIAVQEMHQVAAGSAVNLDVRKGNASSILFIPFVINSTANVPITKSGGDLHENTENRQLLAGDRIRLAVSGTPTSCSHLTVTVWYKFLNQGDYRIE